MTNVPKRRRPQIATRVDDRQQEAILRLLRCYDGDPRFAGAVAALIQRHGDALDWIAKQDWKDNWSAIAARATCPDLAAYQNDAMALADDWGLARFPESRGLTALHRGALDRIRYAGPVPGLGRGLMWVGFCDAPDGAVHIELTDYWDPEDEPIGERTVRVPERLLQLYDYRVNHKMYGAKARLLHACEALIDAELDRIARDYERDGFTFEDTAHSRGDHMQWLYERLAHRRPVRRIADDADVSEGAVRKATEHRTTTIGIDKLPTSKRLSKK